jgi:hypothetical protein
MSREALWEVRMLRYAFFADFKGGPKLLMWGDKSGMTALSQFLREMAIAPREVELSELGFCAVSGDQVIVVPCCKDPCGALRKTSGDRRIFRWELDKLDAERFAGLVDILAASAQGHQYLETARAPPKALSIMVSIGEYPDHLIPKARQD